MLGVSKLRMPTGCLRELSAVLGKSQGRVGLQTNQSSRRSVSQQVFQEANRDRKRAGPTAYLLLAVPLGTFCLGTWQVYRRQWKLELIKALEEKTKAPPVPLPENLDDLEQLEYRKVRLRGTFDHSKEIYIGPRSMIVDGDTDTSGSGLVSSGQSGYNVITPFKLADRDVTVLVNRGFVPRRNLDPSTRSSAQPEGVTEITGVVRLTEKRPQFAPHNKPQSRMFFFRDVDSMSSLLNTDPYFFDAVETDPARNAPVGNQTRVTLRNEHLSYILTWYSLSGLTAFLWYRRFIRGLPLM